MRRRSRLRSCVGYFPRNLDTRRQAGHSQPFMRISFFPNKFGSAPPAEEITWPDFIRLLSPHIIGEKTTQALFSPGEWAPGSERRTKENVIAVHFGVMDFDHLSPEGLQRIQTMLAGLDLAWALYSTFSHGENVADPGEEPRYEGALRLCVPFSRPVVRGDWSRAWPRLLARLGNLGDPSCKDPGRLFFLPTCPPERAHLAIFHSSPGKALDIDELLSGEVAPEVIVEQRKDPINRSALKSFLSKLKRKHSTVAAPLAAVLDGEPWAPPGSRDTVLYSMAGAIAREFPTADMSTVAQEFLTSVQRTRLEDPSTHISMTVVLDKLIRRQMEQIEEDQSKESDSLREKQARIRQAFQGRRSEPYTEAELETFATEAQIHRFDFIRRWILQVGGSYYFFLGGSYVGPYPSTSATGAARVLLAPASSGGVELDTRTLMGGMSPKSIETLALDYGTVSRRIVGDMAAQRSIYDPISDSVIEATCPVRNIVPKFNERIAHWLDVLGGPSDELLRLWI